MINLVLFWYLLMFPSLPGFSQSDDLKSFTELDVHDFFIQMNLVDHEILIDVRSYEEFRVERLKHAILASTPEDLDRLSDTLDFEQPLFVYCDDSFRSTTACGMLVEKGFIHVYLLADGLFAWKKRGLETDKRKLTRKRRNRFRLPG